MASVKPRILRRKTIARTRVFQIEEMELEFANGTRTRYERLVGPAEGAVLIVPMLDQDQVLLVREYAGGMDRYELALPKGKVENNEGLLAAANREIQEEVGYAAHRLERIATLSIAPGYVQHLTHVILARDLYPRRRPGDEPEAIEVVPWRLSQLDTLLDRPDCTEARSIAALYLVQRHLRRESG